MKPLSIVRKFVFVILLVVGAVSIGLWQWHKTTFGVAFLNVGQGDATLIRHGAMQTLVDGGPDRAVLAELGRRMGFLDRRVETVVLTHPHADHLDGLVAVSQRYRISRLIMTAQAVVASETAELRQRVLTDGGVVIVVRAGDVIWLEERLALQVLWAGQQSVTDWNDDSLVLRLLVVPPATAVGHAPTPLVILAGDATADVERELLRSVPERLPATWLKVGHHGAKQSTSVEWLQVVRPQHAVVSVGRNSYGHPSPLILKRLTKVVSEIWRTDHGGSRDVPIR